MIIIIFILMLILIVVITLILLIILVIKGVPGFEAAAQRTDEAALREQERALQRVRPTFSSFAKLFSKLFLGKTCSCRSYSAMSIILSLHNYKFCKKLFLMLL